MLPRKRKLEEMALGQRINEAARVHITHPHLALSRTPVQFASRDHPTLVPRTGNTHYRK